MCEIDLLRDNTDELLNYRIIDEASAARETVNPINWDDMQVEPAVLDRFLPCDAVCTVSVIVILSVRPSVCLSVCKKKVKTSIYIARFMHQAPLTRTSLKLGRQTAI